MTGRHRDAEIEEAYAAFHVEVGRITATGDWASFPDLITPDATYKQRTLVADGAAYLVQFGP